MSAERTLKPADVAALYGLASPRAVYRWINEGKLPALRLPGGQLRFRWEDLYEFERRIAVNAEQPSPPEPETPRPPLVLPSLQPEGLKARRKHNAFLMGKFADRPTPGNGSAP